MERVVFRVRELPDLSLAKYETLSESGVAGVIERHADFLRQWNKICLLNQVSIHLLYTFDPQLEVGKRMGISLILQGGDKTSVETLARILPFSPLAEYYQFEKADEKPCDKVFGACATLIKRERVVEIASSDDKTRPFYYVPSWEPDEKARLYDLFRILSAIGAAGEKGVSCGYRIDLYPDDLTSATDLSHDTQAAFRQPLKLLRDASGYATSKITLSDNPSYKTKDENASDIINQYEGWLKKVETSPHFRAHIYGFADTLTHARMILAAAGAEAVNEGDFKLLEISDDGRGFTAFSRMDAEPRNNYCTDDHASQDAVLSAWPTTFTCDEAAPFFRLPVLFEGEVVETPKETAPPIEEDGLFLGTDSNGYTVRFPLENLPKHAMVSGMPGGGNNVQENNMLTNGPSQQVDTLGRPCLSA
jgi:hypothetical protein